MISEVPGSIYLAVVGSFTVVQKGLSLAKGSQLTTRTVQCKPRFCKFLTVPSSH